MVSNQKDQFHQVTLLRIGQVTRSLTNQARHENLYSRFVGGSRLALILTWKMEAIACLMANKTTPSAVGLQQGTQLLMTYLVVHFGAPKPLFLSEYIGS